MFDRFPNHEASLFAMRTFTNQQVFQRSAAGRYPYEAKNFLDLYEAVFCCAMDNLVPESHFFVFWLENVGNDWFFGSI